MHTMNTKSKKVETDAAKRSKIEHKGRSHKRSQGDDVCTPAHFTEKTGAPGSDKMKFNKNIKLPTEGPFSNPGQGKDQGDKTMTEMGRPDLKASMEISKTELIPVGKK